MSAEQFPEYPNDLEGQIERFFAHKKIAEIALDDTIEE